MGGVAQRRFGEEYPLREYRLNIRRNRIQVRAENDAGRAPGEEEVEGAVADFFGAQLRPVRRREHPRQALGQPLRHLPLLS